MAMATVSGISTPVSSTTTVSVPASPILKVSVDTLEQDVYYNPNINALTILEFIASRANTTSSVYIYDLAERVGLGALTKEWAVSQADTAPVVRLQTRAGAGLTLVGRLSTSASKDALKGSNLTVYTTTTGLSMMAPSLVHLPSPSPSSRLTIHIPNVTFLGETFTLSPSLAPLSSTWSILPEGFVVLLSSAPQQTADFATLAHKLTRSHVIHVFDQFCSARETGHSLAPLPSKTSDVPHTSTVAQAINNAGYRLFDIFGDFNAGILLVMLNGPLARAVAALVDQSKGLAVIVVNVLRPWHEQAFVDILPGSTQTVYVVDEVPNVSMQGSLYVDVFGTLLGRRNGIAVFSHRLAPPQTQEYLKKNGSLIRFLSVIAPRIDLALSPSYSDSKKILLLGTPNSPLAALSTVFENLFFSNKGISACALQEYDMLSKHGGIAAFRLLLSPQASVNNSLSTLTALPLDRDSAGEVDFLAVLDQSLFASHAVLQYANPGSIVLVVTSWSTEEFLSNLPRKSIAILVERQLRLFSIDVKEISSRIPSNCLSPDLVHHLLVHLAFIRLYLGKAATESKVLSVVQSSLRQNIEKIKLAAISSAAWSGLKKITCNLVPQLVTDADHDLKFFETNSVILEAESEDAVVPGTRLAPWHDAAKHLLFPAAFAPEFKPTAEEYSFNSALRPETEEPTFLVTCAVNRRLTPLDYDRNVFHLEFDTSGTGLKYAVGEALGVHGWNDEQEVLDFCAWYGVDPNKLVTIPIPGGQGVLHTRTALQALQQQIDLFGHPPKSFYSDLAAYAKSPVDRHALLFIGSPEGSATYKKFSEKDTVTFVDILKKYPSAKPAIGTLCELIGDIKPRHYSIASAQSVVGDRVDLLVVAVEWRTSNGDLRYGQCTRYLVGLQIGQKVTVSIKPSVMKLPPGPEQPIILAGLGTGAAPFRAFFQHIAWLASQGKDVGPVYYYFGSRHQASEYLYGEEVESYILGGIITHAGLAFSRDGPRKVYIQHKMLEDSEELVRMLYNNKGVFYLCGPTWPVPDVYEALVNALVKYKGMAVEEAGNYLENLKEEERYVLEVY